MTGDPSDQIAPKVVATTPTATASGVGADAKIEITFSEAMDRAAVEAAYSSAGLPLDKVSMAWNADMTVLTISPDQLLRYGSGNGDDPSTAPRETYSITIGAGASDLAGNALGNDFVLGFSTKVRMQTTAKIVSALSRTTLGGSALAENVNVIAGDASVNNLVYRGYVSFDLSKLPQGVAIESAEFGARQLGMEGTPYAALGPLEVYHLSFGTMTSISNVLPISNPGVFSEDGTLESKSIDVSLQAADDIAHRAERGDLSQYRLQFDTTTDSDNAYDRVEFAKDTFEMSLVYIAN